MVKKLVLIAISALTLLTGCVSASSNVVVHANKSIDAHIKVQWPKDPQADYDIAEQAIALESAPDLWGIQPTSLIDGTHYGLEWNIDGMTARQITEDVATKKHVNWNFSFNDSTKTVAFLGAIPYIESLDRIEKQGLTGEITFTFPGPILTSNGIVSGTDRNIVTFNINDDTLKAEAKAVPTLMSPSRLPLTGIALIGITGLIATGFIIVSRGRETGEERNKITFEDAQRTWATGQQALSKELMSMDNLAD